MINDETTEPLTNLLGLTRQQLSTFFLRLGEPTYRSQQLIQWIHQYGVIDFSAMTNLSKAFREKLQTLACCDMPEIALENIASDGTCKWLIRLSDGNSVETVFIPETGRGTLCVSSQVGCALNCTFCSTGRQGFNRNLSSAEIIAQVWLAVRRLSVLQGKHDRAVTNVVMMGMGEPLLNFDNVVAAMDIMMDDFAYGLSKRRVTLSTSGVLPALIQLKKTIPVSLAVSLHAPNDALRNEIVPINKKYPLKMLMDVCRDYYADEGNRVVTMEYVMLAGINDSLQQAEELIRLLRNVPCKVNLIPFNPFPNSGYRCSDSETIQKFKERLMKAHIITTVRKTRGEDIDAACGQLVGNVNDRTSRSVRMAKKFSNAMNEGAQK